LRQPIAASLHCMDRSLDSLVALATAVMTALVLGSIAIDQGVPIGVLRVSALGVAGLLLGAVAIITLVNQRR
jgi:hypothetical protein